MAPHSSTLAWKISWMEEPGRLHSMGLRRVGHDWAISLSLFTFMHRRRKWQPTPVFLPGESQGQRSLVGFCLWGHRVGHNWSNLAAAAGLYLCPWNSPGKNTGVGCHFLLQGIFPTKRLNLTLLPCRQIVYLLSHREEHRDRGQISGGQGLRGEVEGGHGRVVYWWCHDFLVVLWLWLIGSSMCEAVA